MTDISVDYLKAVVNEVNPEGFIQGAAAKKMAKELLTARERIAELEKQVDYFKNLDTDDIENAFHEASKEFGWYPPKD